MPPNFNCLPQIIALSRRMEQSDALPEIVRKTLLSRERYSDSICGSMASLGSARG
jgi:hypothetical protein